MHVTDMDRALDILKNSPCLSDESREAAKHAADLLRAFRSSQNLPWTTKASDLYALAVNLPAQGFSPQTDNT